MSPISPANTVALQILQQSSIPPASAARKPAVDPLLAAVNGVPDPAASEGSGTSLAAKARITEALFSVNSLDLTKMKTNLFERLGKEFGLAMDDFETVAAFGRAIKEVVTKLKQDPEGLAELARIERDLGLTKLGISIDTLVEAMIEPDGHEDDRLEAALLREVKEADEKAVAALRALALQETGLYGF